MQAFPVLNELINSVINFAVYKRNFKIKDASIVINMMLVTG